MENLVNSFAKTSVGTDVAVDEEMLTNLLKTMQANNLSAMSMSELVEHLASMKVEKMKSSSVEAVRTGNGETTPDMGSPDFSFKSPSNVFTPFKMNKSRPGAKPRKDNGFAFGDGEDEARPTRSFSGPFSTPTNTSLESSQSLKQPVSGSFYGISRDSVPSNVDSKFRPGTSESGVFATAGLNSLNTAAKTTQEPAAATANVQFHLGGTGSKTDGSSRRTTSRGGTAKSSGRSADKDSFQGSAGVTAAGAALGNSWFWGTEAATSAPGSAPAFSTTVPAPAAAPIQPFTFTIGSDGTASKRRTPVAASSASASNPQAVPAAQFGPFSTSTNPVSSGHQVGATAPALSAAAASKTVPPQASGSAAPPGATATTSATAPNFMVYTLGDSDILHSLHDYSSDSEGEAAGKTPAAAGATQFPSAGLAPEYPDDTQEGAMSVDTSAAQSPVPSANPAPSVAFPFSAPTSSRPATAAQQPDEPRPQRDFLFDGRSAAASVSQFEKDNFSHTAFGNATFAFSIGSCGNGGSSKTPTATVKPPATATASKPAFDAEATFNRVSQAFAGLAVGTGAGGAAGASASSAPSIFAPVPPVSSMPQQQPPSAFVPPVFAAPAAPVFGPEVVKVPNLAPQGTAGGLSGVNTSAAFNIGSSGTGPALSRKHVKLSPGKKQAGSSGKTTCSSGADTSSNNSIAGDAPPKWWTDAKAESEARQRAHGAPQGGDADYAQFTMPGDLLSDSDDDGFSDDGVGSEEWEDSMNLNLRHADGMMMDDDDEDLGREEGEVSESVSEREELSTARRREPEVTTARDRPVSAANTAPSKAPAPMASPRGVPLGAPHAAQSPRRMASTGPASAPATGSTSTAPSAGPGRPATATTARPSTASGPAPGATTAPAASASRPQTASASAEKPGSAADSAAGSGRKKCPQQGEQQSEASMAHLAELYSKQGKDLYSSGAYARYARKRLPLQDLSYFPRSHSLWQGVGRL
jgi:hypothetical protein